MKKLPVRVAVGLPLCHDVTEIRDGFCGAAFRRGHIITEADVDHLLSLGKKTVYIWEETAGEIHEEDAARRLAAMAPADGAAYEAPGEGKAVLRAGRDGLFTVDTALLYRINAIGDITICTLPDHYPAKKGARLASMRIVPLVTPEAQILAAEALCKGKKLFSFLPYRRLAASVIVTGSELYHGRIKDKFEAVARQKLAAFDCEYRGMTLCDDDVEMIGSAILRDREAGAKLILLSGGMSVDPDDVTPAAIRRTGAAVITQGVPSQPGNMLMLAYLGDTTLVGVPSAAIKSKTTMLDVVLPQIFAGVPFTKADFLRLGDGGLCQQCADCRYPNCTYGKY